MENLRGASRRECGGAASGGVYTGIIVAQPPRCARRVLPPSGRTAPGAWVRYARGFLAGHLGRTVVLAGRHSLGVIYRYRGIFP